MRCAATASMRVQRCKDAGCTAGRSRAGDSRARALANCRKKAKASRPNLPPTSRVSTTSLQRRATGYVWRRLRFGACSSALPGTRSACGCARVTGETKVVSTAAWAPCHRGSPFASTSMRRPSARGTSTFMSRKKTLVATRAPASRQTRAAALSKAAPRAPRTPAVGTPVLWEVL